MKKKMSKKQKAISISGIIILVLTIGRMFYGSFVAGIILMPVGVVIYRNIEAKLFEKKTKTMENQFKDMLIVVSDLMQTGYSIENALIEGAGEIERLYGKDSMIYQEMKLIVSRLRLNMNVEKIIADMANRYDIESMHIFCNTFSIAKRTGGSMREVIKNVCDTIILRQQVSEDIEVAMNAKRLEHRVMMVIPIGLLMYVSFASPGFMDVMYATWMGRIIMSVCLIAYFLGYVWGERIVSVEV